MRNLSVLICLLSCSQLHNVALPEGTRSSSLSLLLPSQGFFLLFASASEEPLVEGLGSEGLGDRASDPNRTGNSGKDRRGSGFISRGGHGGKGRHKRLGGERGGTEHTPEENASRVFPDGEMTGSKRRDFKKPRRKAAVVRTLSVVIPLLFLAGPLYRRFREEKEEEETEAGGGGGGESPVSSPFSGSTIIEGSKRRWKEAVVLAFLVVAAALLIAGHEQRDAGEQVFRSPGEAVDRRRLVGIILSLMSNSWVSLLGQVAKAGTPVNLAVGSALIVSTALFLIMSVARRGGAGGASKKFRTRLALKDIPRPYEGVIYKPTGYDSEMTRQTTQVMDNIESISPGMYHNLDVLLSDVKSAKDLAEYRRKVSRLIALALRAQTEILNGNVNQLVGSFSSKEGESRSRQPFTLKRFIEVYGDVARRIQQEAKLNRDRAIADLRTGEETGQTKRLIEFLRREGSAIVNMAESASDRLDVLARGQDDDPVVLDLFGKWFLIQRQKMIDLSSSTATLPSDYAMVWQE